MGGDNSIDTSKTYHPSIPVLSQGDKDADLDSPKKSPAPSSGGDQFKKQNGYELWGYDTRKLIGILPIAAPLAYFVNKLSSSPEKQPASDFQTNGRENAKKEFQQHFNAGQLEWEDKVRQQQMALKMDPTLENFEKLNDLMLTKPAN